MGPFQIRAGVKACPHIAATCLAGQGFHICKSQDWQAHAAQVYLLTPDADFQSHQSAPAFGTAAALSPAPRQPLWRLAVHILPEYQRPDQRCTIVQE